jgi:redox-sensitive bicupin YhaK (pirin superfamily)
VAVEIRRGTDRFVERVAGRLTQHAFSFGSTYDADHVRFGPMVCHDDHLLRVGEGFPDHPHSDLTIVTWVVSGALAHEGTAGAARVEPGQCAVLHAGAATVHSEVAAAPQTRFVQVWLDPDVRGGEASYDVLTPELPLGELVRVTEPEPGSVLSVVRLGDHQTATIPAGPRTHVYVARGALLRSSLAEPLHEGDAFLFTDEPSYDLTAGVPTDLLVWSFAS